MWKGFNYRGAPLPIAAVRFFQIYDIRRKNDKNMDDKIEFVKINEQDATGRSYIAVAIFINGKDFTETIKSVERQSDKKCFQTIYI